MQFPVSFTITNLHELTFAFQVWVEKRCYCVVTNLSATMTNHTLDSNAYIWKWQCQFPPYDRNQPWKSVSHSVWYRCLRIHYLLSERTPTKLVYLTSAVSFRWHQIYPLCLSLCLPLYLSVSLSVSVFVCVSLSVSISFSLENTNLYHYHSRSFSHLMA